MRINVRYMALDKYEYSVRTTAGCHEQFETDDFALELLRIKFEMGVNRRVWEQKWKAVFQTLQAVITFAVAVGQLCLGSPGGVGQGAAAGRQAIGAVVAAEQIADQVNRILSSVVLTLMQFEKNPNIQIPSTGDISGTSQGDADAAAIVTMAAWDKWLLESDQQMAFAVENNIDGASAYQLALRKHAINGKQLAHAQAEAVNARDEYIQAPMEVIRYSQNIADLQALKAGFHGQEAVMLNLLRSPSGRPSF
ncbi:hypothetical protein DSL72_007449 [Monilinia vaccinii-corymbosi]|uniref:Uncharacterized protein n=1 Tax=Monilinia vaccinii-corymbosi TaxID=61207 RepID=A0A8A3PMU2_9HELO|nr:hypothetical protein DSL72_007449 [Monilinia vaccinii-corymbosi]